MLRAPAVIFKLWVLTTLLPCSWSARVNHVEAIAKLENIGEQVADTNKSEIEKRGIPLRWFKKRMEELLGQEPGTFAAVNEYRLGQVVALLEGRWFGVQGVLDRPEDFFVIDISAQGKGEQLKLLVETNQGLTGTIQYAQLTSAFKSCDKVLTVNNDDGKDIMFMMRDVIDTNYNSLYFAPSGEEVDRSDVMWIYKVSDWLYPADRKKFNRPLPMQGTLDVLYTIANQLNQFHRAEDIPNAQAQEILGGVFHKLPDYYRDAHSEHGYSGGASRPGPYQPNPHAQPPRSAMKGARKQAEQLAAPEARDGVEVDKPAPFRVGFQP